MKTTSVTAVLVLALAGVAAPAAADTTTGTYPACGTEFWPEAMLTFRDTGQDAASNRWSNHGPCIELREGLEVEVVRYYGDAEHKRVEFEINGYRFFTVRRAIAKSL